MSSKKLGTAFEDSVFLSVLVTALETAVAPKAAPVVIPTKRFFSFLLAVNPPKNPPRLAPRDLFFYINLLINYARDCLPINIWG